MEDYTEMKRKKLMDLAAIQQDFVIVNSIYDKWEKQREEHLYNPSNDAAIVTARLREILKNEIVIEFDNCTREEGLKYCNAVISALKVAGISFKAYDHGSRSYHIHILVNGLDALQKQEQHDYKREFVVRYVTLGRENVDMTLFGKKLIALEYAPHFRRGGIKGLVEDYGHDNNRIDQSILSAITKAETTNDIRQSSLLSKVSEKDTKFWGLFNAEWKKYGYPSRSEAEEALVLALMNCEYSEEDIGLIMEKCLIGKWQTASVSYRDATIAKAKVYRENLIHLPDGKTVSSSLKRRILQQRFPSQEPIEKYLSEGHSLFVLKSAKPNTAQTTRHYFGGKSSKTKYQEYDGLIYADGGQVHKLPTNAKLLFSSTSARELEKEVFLKQFTETNTNILFYSYAAPPAYFFHEIITDELFEEIYSLLEAGEEIKVIEKLPLLLKTSIKRIQRQRIAKKHKEKNRKEENSNEEKSTEEKDNEEQ